MPSLDRRVWTPDRSSKGRSNRAVSATGRGGPSWTQALGRGLGNRCPVCGGSPIFDGYLRVRSLCPICATSLAEVPADDAPPWLTIFLSLHVLIGLVCALGAWTTLDTASTVAIVLPVSLLLCLALLRPVKGGVIAVLLKLDVRRDDQGPA